MDPGTAFPYRPPSTDSDSWQQLLIEWTDWNTAEATAARRLLPTLISAEHNGHLDHWFFLRKYPYWRLRHTGGSTAHTRLIQILEELITTGEVNQWYRSIYEPETPTFGGAAAMATAHRLFHIDSCNVLSYVAGEPDNGTPRKPGRRELGLLLISVLLRGAGLDWYEQSDVWYRVACLRQTGRHTPSDQNQRQQVRRLMTADVLQLSSGGPLQSIHDWIHAFREVGSQLADYAEREQLARGLRAVLAHHAIFAWNRLGLTPHDQETLARRATDIGLDDHMTYPAPPVTTPDSPQTIKTAHPAFGTQQHDVHVNTATEIVVRAAIWRDGHLLVAHQQGKSWSFLPGGHVEPGESVETALVRELNDQLSSEATITGLVGAVEHGYTGDETTHHELDLVFEVSITDTYPASEDEQFEFRWLSPNQFADADLRPSSLKSSLIAAGDSGTPFWQGWSG